MSGRLLPTDDAQRAIRRRNNFRRATEEAAGGHLAPRADVIEDKDAFHDLPSLNATARVEVQVAWPVSGERLCRIVQGTSTR
jgi:hypothetical protein